MSFDGGGCFACGTHVWFAFDATRGGNVMESATIPWLVMFLGKRLRLAWVPQELDETFTGDGETFYCVTDDVEALNQFPAFFDRLYDSSGRLVGLQVTPMVWADLPLIVGTLPFAQSVNEEKQLRIFFTNVIPPDVLNVGDQAFGGGIYRSNSGEIAISCDTYFLEDREREVIDKATPLRVMIGTPGNQLGNAQ